MIQGTIERVAEKKNIDASWFYGIHFRPTSGRGVMKAYKRIKCQQVFMRTVLVLFLFLVAFMLIYAYMVEGLSVDGVNKYIPTY